MECEELVEFKTQDINYSKSRVLNYQGVSFFNEETQEPYSGEYVVDEVKMRFKDGLLHGGKTQDNSDIPAYETNTGHIEFLENGLLHRENAPAIISDFGNWEEWWSHGTLIIIRCFGKIEKEIVLYKEE